MPTRRTLLLGASVVMSASAMGPVIGQEAVDAELVSALPPLPDDLAGQAGEPPAPYADTTMVGTAPPTDQEKDEAFEILLNSPFATSPIDVAQYFLAVGAGAYGPSLRKYAREWPVRANPAIAHFFSATQTRPEGDTTAWCAAFLNWCLMRARASTRDQIGTGRSAYSRNGRPFDTEVMKAHSTNSAASGSFRCWARTDTPRRGDIVVFANKGTEGLTPSCRGQGHVAFYLGVPRADWVRVLGGNQILAGSNGAVTVADYRTGTGSRFFGYVTPK